MNTEPADDGNTPRRWLVVCDCAGQPAELLTVIDDYRHFKWLDGTPRPFVEVVGVGAFPALDAERTYIYTDPQNRTVGATMTIRHEPCNRSPRLNPSKMATLLDGLAAIRRDTPELLETRMFPVEPSPNAKLVDTPCISLGLLCHVNGDRPPGATRPRR